MEKAFNLKSMTEEFLAAAGFPHSEVRETLDDETGFTLYEAVTDKPSFYLSNGNEVLSTINFLAQRIAEERLPGVKSYFFIDVGGHYAKLINEIKVKAKIMAERARSFGRDIECEPMHPAERLVIHSFLSRYPEVETESRGTGAERHLVIKYSPDKGKI